MDRKGIIAVVLAAALLVYWQIENSKKLAEQAKEKQRAELLAKANATPAPAPGSSPSTATTTPGTPSAPGAASTQPAAAAPEKVETAESASIQFEFTSAGGGIKRALLKKHTAEHGAPVMINQFSSIPIGAISERAGEGFQQPFTAVAGTSSGEVLFEATDARQLQIRKRFVLPKTTELREEYVTTLEVTFANKGAQALQLPGYYVYTGAAAPIHQNDAVINTGLGWLAAGRASFKKANEFTQGGLLMFGKTPMPVFAETREHTEWIGVTNQYFSTIVLQPEADGNGLWARHFTVEKALVGAGAQTAEEPLAGRPDAEKIPEPDAQGNVRRVQDSDAPKLDAVEAALAMPALTLQPGDEKTQKFEIYTGPREFNRLKSLGHGEDEMMDFGTFKVVSKVLLNSMNWLHSKLGSYAAAIIVLTIIIRGLMWPLQNKATQSMKRMQALSPKMTELKEKYKDDSARMNQELMKLYKDYQINPLSGCLPMVVQIPIFFGFYNMLGKAVELRNSKFLWVHDLSQMDTVATVMGQPINVLPLLMAGTMFWQMSLSPKSGDATQQKVFMFMPMIFVLFCYKYASALALYWTVQNIFSVVQLYITRNKTTPVLQKVSAPSKKR